MPLEKTASRWMVLLVLTTYETYTHRWMSLLQRVNLVLLRYSDSLLWIPLISVSEPPYPYQGHTQGQAVYNCPLRIYFDQAGNRLWQWISRHSLM